MKLGSGFTAEAVRQLGNGWLGEFRLESWRQFERTPFPQRTDEEWRRTDVSKLDMSDVVAVSPRRLQKRGVGTCPEAIVRASTCSGSLFLLPDGVISWQDEGDYTLTTLEHAAELGVLQPRHLSTAQERTEKKFSALSDAFFSSGAFVHVRPGVQVPLPFVIRHYGSGARDALFPRGVVVLERDASAVVVDDYETVPEARSLSSGVVDLWLGEGSRLQYIRVNHYGRGVASFCTVRAHLKRGASLELITVGVGGGVNKEYYEVRLEEPETRLMMVGMAVGRGNQHYDATAKVDHVAPHATSEMTVKSAVKERARSIFIGNIRLEKKAVKTDAVQQIRSLLLSREARAEAIPRLEILADDVRCAHGAAIGSLDEEQIYYLLSRGIPRADAERLVVEGFFEDVVGKIPVREQNERIREYLKTLVIRSVQENVQS